MEQLAEKSFLNLCLVPTVNLRVHANIAFKISYPKVYRKQKIAEYLQSTECRQNTAQTLFRMCGIPQAWYGAGLLSLWSKGRVGSIPTSRAIIQIQLSFRLF